MPALVALLMVPVVAACREKAPPEPAARPGPPSAAPSQLPRRERLSKGATAQMSLPLAIILRGRDEAEEPLLALADELSWPARVLVLPVRESTSPGAAFHRNGAPLESAGAQLAKEADYLAGELEALSPPSGSRRKPVLVGFSEGGALALALAARHPTSIAAAIVVGGWLPRGVLADGHTIPPFSLRVFVLHGGDDALVPAALGSRAADDLAERGYAAALELDLHAGHGLSPRLKTKLLSYLADELATAEKTP